MPYLLGTEDDYLAIFDTESASCRIEPLLSVVIRNKEELAELESILSDPESDLNDYLDENFELDVTYFTNDYTMMSSVDYEEYLCLIKEGVLYDLEKKRFMTEENFSVSRMFWMIGRDNPNIFFGPFQRVEEIQDGLFKSSDDRYFTWDQGDDTAYGVIELDLKDEEAIQLALLPFNEALGKIEEYYPVTLESGIYEDWGAQWYFKTADDYKIWTVSTWTDYLCKPRLANREVQDILDEVRSAC